MPSHKNNKHKAQDLPITNYVCVFFFVFKQTDTASENEIIHV